MKVPAYYELGLSQNGQAVQIRVHPDALRVLQDVPWETAPLVTDAASKEGLTFTKPHKGDCGFENAFKLVASNRPVWIVWEFKLPKIKSDEYKTIYALRLTIYAFLSVCLRDPIFATGWDEPQLINILAFETLPGGRGNGGLGACLSEPADSCLRDESNHVHFPQIAEAMKVAYKFMMDGGEGRNGIFRTYFENEWSNLTTSGDGTYINGEVRFGECEIGPHNVDSAVQQLSLLCGLTALHDFIRKG